MIARPNRVVRHPDGRMPTPRRSAARPPASRNVISGNGSSGIQHDQRVEPERRLGQLHRPEPAWERQRSATACTASRSRSTPTRTASAAGSPRRGTSSPATVPTASTSAAPAATQILGNYLGTDVTGNVDLGNSGRGVYIESACEHGHRRRQLAAGNLISGNTIRRPGRRQRQRPDRQQPRRRECGRHRSAGEHHARNRWSATPRPARPSV